jgi:arylsulfatase
MMRGVFNRLLLVSSVAAPLILIGCAGEDHDIKTRLDTTPVHESRSESAGDQRPNILLIVADDLGYTDLGVYGGEIHTPHLDALARGGVMFTQFYASPMCSTTRAMLMTGMDHHLTGFGNLAERLSDNQKGQPGYEGHLNPRVVTLAEVLKDAGYRTYMAGKWHLGSREDQADPSQRGFDRSFALLESGAGHFDNMLPLVGPGRAEYSEDGEPRERLPEDFYSTRFYAEKLLEYLEADKNDDRPFFAYLAFTAPHFPLQAPAASIAKYHGNYDGGYEELHARRLSRMRKLDLIEAGVESFPRSRSEPAWDELSPDQRKSEARKMEIYAAMIDDVDRYVGKVVDSLRVDGSYDNTVIVFMSDNGAEGHALEHGLGPLARWAEQCCDSGYEAMGGPNSYLLLGPNWARTSAAPFRMFKGFTSEGGIRAAAFVHYPSRFPSGRNLRAFVTVMDVMPTLLDLAFVRHPGSSHTGNEALPMQGTSMLSVLQGEADTVHDEDHVTGWELFGKRAIRRGDWKIMWETSHTTWWDAAPLGINRDTWQLYDLATDPAELDDLSQRHPDRLEQMIGLWDSYARENGVIIPDKQRGY